LCALDSAHSHGGFAQAELHLGEVCPLSDLMPQCCRCLAKAVSALDNDNADAREELYERARAALKAEFDKRDPPPSEFDVLEERLKLNFAIHDLEWFDCR
jgi:hypothetical protein